MGPGLNLLYHLKDFLPVPVINTEASFSDITTVATIIIYLKKFVDMITDLPKHRLHLETKGNFMSTTVNLILLETFELFKNPYNHFTIAVSTLLALTVKRKLMTNMRLIHFKIQL